MLMETQFINCQECGHKMSNKNYAISRHVKKHDLDFNSYIRKYYILTNGNFKKCSFCEKEALPTYLINHENLNYKIIYEKGYACNTLECKKQISLDILGIEYDPKKFEKIGSRSDYLAKLYNIDISNSKKMKYDTTRTNFFKCSLDGFVSKYGIEIGVQKYYNRIEKIKKSDESLSNPKNRMKTNLETYIKKYGIKYGTEKYNDRCAKIAYTNTFDYFISKYGAEQGPIKYKQKNKVCKISKRSKIIGNILNDIGINYKIEEIINGKKVDYFLPDHNIVIEFFGDYWHCNPKKYKYDFIHPHNKITAKEIWYNDKNRLNKIHEKVCTIIIIWEDTNIDSIFIEKTLNDFRNIKTIVYI